ncbi:MAG TPA: hypothetical protein VMU50_10375 [Polyangia bacterium]|nr:hypothetical protein [Polyangia bacterium]
MRLPRRFLSLSFPIVIAAGAALAACGSSKPSGDSTGGSGGTGGNSDPGEASRLPPAQRGELLAVSIVGPTATDKITTTATSISLEGVAFGAPSEIRWQSPTGNGIAAGIDTWAVADIPLATGENFITIDAVASDGTHATKSITVQRNTFLGVEGMAQMTPPAGFVGDDTEIVVSAALDFSAGSADSASLRLVQVDPSGGIAGMIATMADDGDFGNSGDEIAGDGVYSARFRVTKTQESALTLAVTGTDSTGATNEAAALGAVPFVSHASDDQLMGAAATVTTMDASFQAAKTTGDLSAAYGAANAAAAQDPNVAHTGISSGGSGTWTTSTAGIVAGMLDGNGDERGSVEIGNHGTFCGAAGNHDFAPTDETADAATTLAGRSCPAYDTRDVFSDDDVTIANLRTLTRHGLVFLTMHGTSYDDLPGTPAASQLPAHEFLLTAEKVTAESLRSYELELKTGQMAIGPVVAGAQRFFITPKFIDALPGRFPNSLVYVGACRSFWNGEFAAAFLRKGAAAFFGYSDMVKSAFAYQTGTAFLQCLLMGGSTASCFTADQHDDGSGSEKRGAVWPTSATYGGALPKPVAVIHHPAYFKMLARQELTIASVVGLSNGDFEQIDRSDPIHPQSLAWQGGGDARVVSKLGGYQPTGGTKMGFISTGLGFTQENGELYQTFCIPAGVTQLAYDWNFISAEFKTYCNDPRYQDNLAVTLEQVAAGGVSTTLQATKIDDLCPTIGDSLYQIPAYNYVDPDGSFATGWQHAGPIDVSKWAGVPTNLTLRFSLKDRGDHLFESIVLLDGITLQ